MTRRLALARETLTELTPEALAGVNAGIPAITPGCPTYPVGMCLTFLTCDPTCHTE